MLKQTMEATSPLDGYSRKFADITLAEVVDTAIVSIAFPFDSVTALQDKVTKAYSTSLPDCGDSTVSKDGWVRFLGVQSNQIFALFDVDRKNAVNVLANQLGNSGYYTDQSDSWVMLRLSGPEVLTVLERSCPLDLSPDIFGPGRVARTAMEHLSTIILRERFENFFFMSPRSSARSFLHVLETSIMNTL